MKSLIKKAIQFAGFEVKRISSSETKKWKVVSLRTKEIYRGRVLLSFRTDPFLNPSVIERHISAWMCVHIAETFLDCGYSVDVIDYQNDRFIPKKDYDIFIDTHSNLERIGPLLNRECLKVLLIVWAHWMFHNYANYKRHLELQQRRNLVLKPKRQLQPTKSIEMADLIFAFGNQFTLGTYGAVQKSVFQLPIPSQIICPFPEDKDYDSCKRNYLYLSGFGAVHKGLDLVLEAFNELPDHHLYVCCRLEDEKDFEDAYYKELFETPNIHNLGFVDITSREFIEIANRCIGVISPSCSEGGSGAVINCSHAGLIPIMSYECGIDIPENSGLILEKCSVEEIKNAVKMFSSLPAEELKLMSRNVWEFARKNHTRERFAEEFRKIANEILEKHQYKLNQK
ncbi:MAG: hypothetical protein ACK4ND_10980 [Cytophagaceae bacterium]